MCPCLCESAAAQTASAASSARDVLKDPRPLLPACLTVESTFELFPGALSCPEPPLCAAVRHPLLQCLSVPASAYIKPFLVDDQPCNLTPLTGIHNPGLRPLSLPRRQHAATIHWHPAVAYPPALPQQCPACQCSSRLSAPCKAQDTQPTVHSAPHPPRSDIEERIPGFTDTDTRLPRHCSN